MPSPEFTAALKHFPKDIAVPGDSYEDVRRKFAPAHGHDPGPDIAVEPASAGGVAGVWVAKKGELTPERTIFFVHGGAFVSCPAPTYTFYAAWLVRATGARAFVVDYRLAPEHRFPAALEDAWAATRWASGHAGGPLAIGGDSSGGNLAAVVARRARDHGIHLVLQLLVYPALDLTGDVYWFRQYLGEHTAADPDASPLLAGDLGGVAPALILSCELDELRPQAAAYEHALSRAGVPVRHVVYPGLIHTAYRMPGVLPGARRMLEDSAAALADAFAG